MLGLNPSSSASSSSQLIPACLREKIEDTFALKPSTGSFTVRVTSILAESPDSGSTEVRYLELPGQL